MSALFSKTLLEKSIFKWEDLGGKELVISVGTYPDELGRGTHIKVLGVEKITGNFYVLVNELRRYQE